MQGVFWQRLKEWQITLLAVARNGLRKLLVAEKKWQPIFHNSKTFGKPVTYHCIAYRMKHQKLVDLAKEISRQNDRRANWLILGTYGNV